MGIETMLIVGAAATTAVGAYSQYKAGKTKESNTTKRSYRSLESESARNKSFK